MLGTSPNVTIFLWALSAFSVLCRTPVYGWGAKGHQMVAHIAEAHLEKGSARALAKRLDQQFSVVERKAWEAGTPKEWADESLAITTAYVYPLPESREIGGLCETGAADLAQAGSAGGCVARVVAQ